MTSPGPWERPAETSPPPVPEPIFADYFDGRRALRNRVALSFEDGARGRVLRLELADGEVVRWPSRRLRRVADQAGSEDRVYGLVTGDPARLVVSPGPAQDLLSRLASETDRPLPGPPLWRRALLVAGAGVVSVAFLLMVLLPGVATVLSRFMSPEAEVALGELTYQQTRVMFAPGLTPLRECFRPEGNSALQQLTERVADGVDLPFPLQVAVLDDSESPILNAYAVAGGRITFFDSMIQAAESPDEIAAVLAHELGHVVNADPVRHTLQAVSGMAVVSVLIGDITGGGVLGGTAGAALQSSYSRQAELEADAFAHEQLHAVGLPPSALARMFERLRAEYGDVDGLVAHFSSHPQLADRIETAGRVGDPVIGAPALTPKDWQALRAICR
ncbi:metalloendopeptidase [Jannaschia pagri]|uniref:Metalloendopeptidase n=1 Tax=Jannaschia pagri TaxID=2829797 RepID=A0ABQ4NGW2_9RHOB|nr:MULTISPECIES: M48 family metallopeptidase [unclassified Jannaschia]GIT90244.1 metalloendopeptidase [Jannaschia sp. AI_61]GIT93650.1 metalloendopeptidase [Jannaschia sp. AI_62]